MVLRKDKGWKNTYHPQQKVQWKVGNNSISTNNPYDSVRKNELFHAISPYDEIPAIRDLCVKLSPEPRQDPGDLRQPSSETRQTRQTRQEAIRNAHRQTVHQKRDAEEKPFDAPSSFAHFSNSAHEVPSTIELPILPSLSEDSELSLDEFFSRNNDKDNRDQPSSAIHSFDVCDIYSQLSRMDVFHQSYHASADVRGDIEWPSDEDTAPASKNASRREKTKGI